MDSELDRRPTHSCTIEAAGSVREVGMNLARGRELGISSRVDEGHDWIHKPSRSSTRVSTSCIFFIFIIYSLKDMSL